MFGSTLCLIGTHVFTHGWSLFRGMCLHDNLTAGYKQEGRIHWLQWTRDMPFYISISNSTLMERDKKGVFIGYIQYVICPFSTSILNDNLMA